MAMTDLILFECDLDPHLTTNNLILERNESVHEEKIGQIGN